MRPLNLAVVGATGAVGQEFLKIFAQRQVNIKELRLFASSRSAGKSIRFNEQETVLQELSVDGFKGVDFALFSAGTEQSKEWAPLAADSGAIVIDNSSAFRMDPTVPLVIPEINLHHVQPNHRIIANPNCSTIMMLMGVAPLCKLGKVKRIIVSTYQAASGAGAAAMQDLVDQTKDSLEGKPPIPKILPHIYAFNLFSHDSAMAENGYNGEENKMVLETKKILGDPEILVNPTCIRVPVLRAHSESITVEFDRTAPSVEEARCAIGSFPGVSLVDDRENNIFPMPLNAADQDNVFIGRIRQDISNPNALSLFVSGDQIRKGAALNAWQIAEALVKKNP